MSEGSAEGPTPDDGRISELESEIPIPHRPKSPRTDVIQRGRARLLAQLGGSTMQPELSDSSTWKPPNPEVRGEDLAAPFPFTVGHYTIVRELGAGGMGVVHVAYDERLDRRVALKLLRLRLDNDDRAQLRLQREARAMARLSHPNVVTVHEVGTVRERVFVAMEFVDGQNLRQWLATERRSWRQIVAAFMQAGEGLTAAHDAGITHRDFKPDNVLVGKDGRLRVADFGLAHAFDANGEPGESRSTVTNPLQMSLTRTGMLLGTPSYMAPEQFRGTPTDARTDQFCFCVALWEALYGQRPFSGNDLASLSSAVCEGRLDEPPATIEVPAWLRAVLERGLSPLPEQRWPSMRALLDVLANDPQARRIRRLRGAAMISALTVLLGVLGWLGITELNHNVRQRYWNNVTEELLGIERERGARQINDDALRARDAVRMSMSYRYLPNAGITDHRDPMIVAALLREVEGSARESETWSSMANMVLGRPLSRAVLSGHRSEVRSLEFGLEGHELYSGSLDGEVWRWDLATGSGRRIGHHDAAVTHLVLSPEGTPVSSHDDGTVLAWSDERSELLLRHDAQVARLAFSRDGTRLVSASWDNSARVLERRTGATVMLSGHEGHVYTAEFDSDGRRVITGSADHDVNIWRAADGALLTKLEGHEWAVYHARFVDADRVLTASDDRSVRLWQLAGDELVGSELVVRFDAAVTVLDVFDDRFVAASTAGEVCVGSWVHPHQLVMLERHSDQVWDVRFTPSGEHVITTSLDSTARMTRADGRGPSLEFEGHPTALSRMALDRTGRWLATGSYDGTLRLWDLDRPRLDLPLEGHEGELRTVDFERNGEQFVTTGYDGTARIWSAKDGTSLGVYDPGFGSLTTAVFSPTGRELAASTSEGHVALWDVQTGELRLLRGHQDTVWGVAFDSTGGRLASSSTDGTARIWDVATGRELQILHAHTPGKMMWVDFGDELVTASQDGTVRYWDPNSGALRATMTGEGGFNSLRRSPDGRTIAAGTDNGITYLFPDDVPEHARVLRGHQMAVWSVAFDSTGERLVTGSFDRTARVWTVDDGSLDATLEGHTEELWDARFMPDGRVITASDDNTIRLWSLEDRRPPLVLTGHEDAVLRLEIGPAGDSVVSVSADGTARIWRIDLFETDPDLLHARLVEATSFCLPSEQRIRELGDDAIQARAAFLACEHRYGR